MSKANAGLNCSNSLELLTVNNNELNHLNQTRQSVEEEPELYGSFGDTDIKILAAASQSTQVNKTTSNSCNKV